jgi:hypothetical protein
MADPTKLCFVVGPIGSEGSAERKHSDFLLRLVIQPVMTEWPDFAVKRADQISTPGMIDRQIITRLRDADLVIADLATLNPNAFYEIGIRHMTARPIVHMQQISESIPFDVSLYSAVKYSLDSMQAIDRAVIDLRGHVLSALDPSHEIDNPVTRALGQVSFQQTALPEIQLLRAELDSLKSAVASILEEGQWGTRNPIAAALANYPNQRPSSQSSSSDLLGEQSRKLLAEMLKKPATKLKDM